MDGGDRQRDRPRRGPAGYVAGQIVGFDAYLRRALRATPKAVVWPGNDIRHELSARAHGERGTLALVNPDLGDAGAVAPGLSLAVQVVRPGDCTRTHAHSFWHLYLVQEGHGVVDLGDCVGARPLVAGDILLLPAWCPHAFDNRDGTADLVLIALQNLPQCAALGSVLVRDGQDGPPHPLYAASDRAGEYS
ncbi:MAG TPA: cupin domain-containing protein [Vineibacter sp.]|nr:cupin domain-containing protein [Vineibacter sp.]